MKTQGFNKFGDTTFRVANQISAYISFSNWLIENYDSDEFRNNQDHCFKQWCNEEGIYHYPAKEKFNRYKMVLHQAVNVYRIIAFNEKGRPYLTFDNNNLINSLFNNIVAGSDETHIAFKKMIKFMCDNRNCNDAMRLSKAFFVCEKEDDFEDLYYSDILNLIASRFTQTFDGKFRFRKPNPLRDKTLEKIIEYKRMGSFDLSFSDLEQKFIKKAFSDKQKLINARDLETFLKEHTLEQILHKLFYVKYKNLLEGDYLDLFNRFMWGLKLADSSSKRTTKYNNDKIEHSDNSYIINIQKDISNFPYSVNEVNNYLKEIQNNVWNWKDKNSNLSSKTNSTLAEYFVNLKFCYLLNISPLDFRKFVNTKVSDELQPVFTASGGESDMLYKINNTIISIETTILKTPRAIINNERYPCIRLHIPIDEKTNKIILNFINFLGNDNEIRRMFDHDWELQFPNFNNKFLNIANFLELAERNKI